MDYEEMILAAQEERDEWYDENEDVHEVYNPIIRQMIIEAGMTDPKTVNMKVEF